MRATVIGCLALRLSILATHGGKKEQARVARLNTFELMARAWHVQAQKDREWSAGCAGKVIRRLEIHIFPWIGSRMMDRAARN